MDLIRDILEHLQGIFLWAYQVIDNLLADIRLDYSLETVKENLKQTANPGKAIRRHAEWA
jgi:hypothetical protein